MSENFQNHAVSGKRLPESKQSLCLSESFNRLTVNFRGLFVPGYFLRRIKKCGEIFILYSTLFSYNSLVKKVLVIGGGAAGIMAALKSAEGNCEVILLEKMSKPGLKILVSGKGRCNVTNAGSARDLIEAFGKNGRFLYHSFSVFSNSALIDFLRLLGVETKTERGNRVFPKSDRSKDVLNALKAELEKRRVRVRISAPVVSLNAESRRIVSAVLKDGSVVRADFFVLATGGKSFPGLGTTGDGYKILRKLRHTVTPLYPALVPLITKESFVKDLEGLSLRNVKISLDANENGKRISYFGDMVFTSKGISGPIVLTLSSQITPKLSRGPVKTEIDLKPALTDEVLDRRLVREFSAGGPKRVKNVFKNLLPVRLIPVFLNVAEIDGDKKCAEITKKERRKIAFLLKHFPLTVTGTEGFAHAIVTKGGVLLKEVDPKTMRSKIYDNLFITGELLNLDAVTGGYNLQAAFSTGFVAGETIKSEC